MLCGASCGPSPAERVLSVSSSGASFEAIQNGAVPPSQTVTVTPTASSVADFGYSWGDCPIPNFGPSWFTIRDSCDARSCDFTFSVDGTSAEPGDYACSVKFLASDASGHVIASYPFRVKYTVTGFRVSPTPVALGGADGLSSPSERLTFSLFAGGTQAYSLQLSTSTGGEWLHASALAGEVGASSTSVQLTADPTGLGSGSHEGSVALRATVGGALVERVVPVVLNREAHRLALAARGVGLSAWPGASMLSRAITVASSIGRTDVPWSASSDQPWLSVTPAGLTGEAVTLTADPTGLAPDATHLATVTVTSLDASIENDATIRVAVTVLGTAPASVSVAHAATRVVASPVEPLVFLNAGGADVVGVDVYSGGVRRSFTGIVGRAGSMTVSPDGLVLYVHDLAASAVKAFDAVSGTLLQQFQATADGSPLLAFEPTGSPVLLARDGLAVDLATGSAFGPSQLVGELPTGGAYTSPPGSRYLATNTGAWSVTRSALGGGRLIFDEVAAPEISGYAMAGCITADESAAYFAMTGVYALAGFDLADRSQWRLSTGAYPNAAVCTWNGLVIGGQPFVGTGSIHVFAAETKAPIAELAASVAYASYEYGGLRDNGIAVSADGTRLITLVAAGAYRDQYEVALQTLPLLP